MGSWSAPPNRVLTDFLETGVYDRRRPLLPSLSPSMDILVSGNLERLLYLASGRDAARVRGWMEDLNTRGTYQVTPEVLAEIRQDFTGGSADDAQTRAAIARAFGEHRVLLDPHAAAGFAVMRRAARQAGRPRVLLATASPFKFPRAVCALGAPGDGAGQALAGRPGAVPPRSRTCPAAAPAPGARDETPSGRRAGEGAGMRSVIVPATTANLGPGFDCLGLALSLYARFTFENGPGLKSPDARRNSGETTWCPRLPRAAGVRTALPAASRLFRHPPAHTWAAAPPARSPACRRRLQRSFRPGKSGVSWLEGQTTPPRRSAGCRRP